MADKNITVEVAVTTKGAGKTQQALKANREEIERTSAAQTKATGAQDAYNKRDKAIYQGNLASAKSFSKLSQTIGAGSSGLVGAYATLASNIFVAVSAFNALRSAAQIDQLSKSLEFLGNAAGRNLETVSNKLQEVTGYAISSADAMRAASFGFSAGFSTEQLVQLAKVAQGASNALGRNLTDAYDRLIRGTAKLEPEILDELGIIVKLDKALEDYAVTVGKSVKDLSAYERTQAFVNATTVQGIQKYGDLSNSLASNPYDKLAASLNNFVVQASKIIMVINPLIEAMSNSFVSLSGIITLFVSGFAKQLIPSLYELPKALARGSEAVFQNTVALSESLGVNVKTSKAYKETIDTIREGNYSTEVFTEGQKQLTASIRGTEGAITKLNNIKNVSANTAQVTSRTNKYSSTIAELTSKKDKLTKRDTVKTALANYKNTSSAATKDTAEYANKVARTEATLTAMEAKQKKLSNSIRGTKAAFTTFTNSINDAQNGSKELNGKLAAQEAQLKGLHAEQAKLNSLKAAANIQSAKNGIATGLETAATGSLGAGIKATTISYIDLVKAKMAATNGAGILTKANAVLSLSFAGVATAASLVATTLLRFLPYIGIFMALLPPLIDWVSKLFTKEEFEAKSKVLKDISDDFTNFKEQVLKTDTQFKVNFSAEGARSTEAAITAMIGLLSEVSTVAIDAKAKLEGVFLAQNAVDAKEKIEGYNNEIKEIQNQLKSGQRVIQATNADIAAAAMAGAGLGPVVVPDKTVKLTADEIKNLESRVSTLRGLIVEAEQSSSRLSASQASEVAKETNSVINNAIATIKGTDVFDKLAQQLGSQDRVLALLEQRGANLSAQLTGNIDKDSAKVNQDLLGYLQSLVSAQQVISDSATAFSKQRQEAARAGATEFSDMVRELEKVKTAYDNADEAGKRFLRSDSKDSGASIDLALTKLPALQAAELAIIQNQKLADMKTEEAQQLRLLNNASALVAAQRLEAEANQLNVQTLTEKINVFTMLGYSEERILELTREKQALELKVSSELENQTEIINSNADASKEQLDLRQKLLDSTKSIVDAEERIARARVQMAALTDRNRESPTLTAAEEQKIFEDSRAAREKLIEDEYSIKKAMIDLEYGVIEAQYKLLAAQTHVRGLETGDIALLAEAEALDQRILKIQELKTSLDTSLKRSLEADLADLNVQGQTLKTATIQEGKTATKEAIPTVPGAIDFEEVFKKSSDSYNAVIKGFEAQGQGKTFFAQLQAGAVAASLTMGPFIEQLKQLGPDGQLIGAIAQGTTAISSSIATMGQAFTDLSSNASSSATKFQAVGSILSATSAIIGSIGQIQQASSQQSIAGIDKEIEAEKKRDGKSKESLAKIAALEKKKEQEKKKAFEQNKKMLMAQTVMNTAAAIMNTMATAPWPVNLVMAALIGALGAAQLAVIAGSSYQGGASGSGGASVPKAVEAGERSNKVDVSQRPTGGELAYIQGARGMGTNANNFTPAFMGAKYRATGGYVVGEQGPELFLPDVPGTIVPSDETRQMSAPVNVTFSVSAIDASSFNDMLADQRGNIISLIREAANLSGEPFLESVNTIPMSPTQRTYYRKA